MFVIILIIFVFLLLYVKWTNLAKFWHRRGIKYVEPLPIVGCMLPQILKQKSLSELIEDLYFTFPEEKYIGVFQMCTPVLILRDLDLIKEVTVKKFENFNDHVMMKLGEYDKFWYRGLFSSSGAKWHKLRQILSPVFTTSKMKSMFQLMDQSACEFIAYLKGQHLDLMEIDAKDTVRRVTNDIIVSTALGIKINAYEDSEFFNNGVELTDTTGLNRLKFFIYSSFPMLAKIFKIKMVSTKVGNFFKNVVQHTITVRETENIVRPDLIHLLMEARKGQLEYEQDFSLMDAGFATALEAEGARLKKNEKLNLDEDDITAQALIFYFGGFDTSSVLISFTLYEIAVNFRIQKRLRQEVELVEGNITYEKLFQMKYMDMVISEALRKWPPAALLDRLCLKDTILENRLQLKKGDVIWIPVMGFHYDPKYFSNPTTFDPERFSDENKGKIEPGSYMPFGLGPRNCIGSRFALMEAKILIYYLLKNFEIVPIKRTQIPLKFDRNQILPNGEKGIWLGLKKRP